MCRNVSFASRLAGIMLWIGAWRAPTTTNIVLSAGVFLLAIGLFGRFLKFDAVYAREVLRIFDKPLAKP